MSLAKRANHRKDKHKETPTYIFLKNAYGEAKIANLKLILNYLFMGLVGHFLSPSPSPSLSCHCHGDHYMMGQNPIIKNHSYFTTTIELV